MLRAIHAQRPDHLNIITAQGIVDLLSRATDFHTLALAEPVHGRRVVLGGPPLAPRLQGQVAVCAACAPQSGGHAVVLLDDNGREFSAEAEVTWAFPNLFVSFL